jgi:hypothetical protein
MSRLFSTIAALVLAFVATPALANETTSLEGEVATEKAGWIFIPALSSVLASATSESFAQMLATPCDISCAAEVVEPVTEEDESPISVGGTVVSQYTFSDLYVQIDSPTVQGWASVDTGVIGIDGCSVDFFAAHGLTTTAAREVDLGASCRFDLSESVTAEVSASRYVLWGMTDIITLEGRLTSGAADVLVTQYIVDGAESDATKVEVGYTVAPTTELSVRGVLVYEHGFGLSDIYVGGAEASYAVSDHWSLTAAGYAPIYRAAGDPRSAQVVVGVMFNY